MPCASGKGTGQWAHTHTLNRSFPRASPPARLFACCRPTQMAGAST